MTLNELVKDLQLIVSKSKIPDDFRIGSRHMEFLFHKHRAEGIRQQFKRNLEMDPSWIQNFGSVKFTNVLSSDDPNINSGTVHLGKWESPSIVSVGNQDEGFHRVSSGSRMRQFSIKSFDRFMSIIETIAEVEDTFLNPRASMKMASRIGNHIYTHPFEDCMNVSLILDNPLDGIILDTSIVEKDLIEEDVQYVVTDAQIIYNLNALSPGDFFKGVAGVNTYAGQGNVKHDNKKRRLTDQDQYPISHALASFVGIQILTKELRIEAQVVSDIINDAADQLRIISNAEQQESKGQSKG